MSALHATQHCLSAQYHLHIDKGWFIVINASKLYCLIITNTKQIGRSCAEIQVKSLNSDNWKHSQRCILYIQPVYFIQTHQNIAVYLACSAVLPLLLLMFPLFGWPHKITKNSPLFTNFLLTLFLETAFLWHLWLLYSAIKVFFYLWQWNNWLLYIILPPSVPVICSH